MSGEWETLGALVHREIEVVDANGYAVNPTTKTVTVWKPDGTSTDVSGTVTAPYTGVLALDYSPVLVGRHILTWRTTVPQTAIDDWFEVVTYDAGSLLTLAEVKVYLGTTSWSDAEITDALNAEADAQRAACRIGSVYPLDLKQALARRVQRNLTMRGLPLAMQTGDAGVTFVGGRDPEIRRLEGPYRKLVVG